MVYKPTIWLSSLINKKKKFFEHNNFLHYKFNFYLKFVKLFAFFKDRKAKFIQIFYLLKISNNFYHIIIMNVFQKNNKLLFISFVDKMKKLIYYFFLIHIK